MEAGGSNMNQVESNRKFTRGLIVQSSQRNSLKCTSREDPFHILTKFRLANYCWQHDIEFFTEAEMKTGGRADFIIADWKLIIEIYDTEKKQSLLDKSLKYPQGLGFIPLQAGTSEDDVWKMLDDLSSTLGSTWTYYYTKWKKEE